MFPQKLNILFHLIFFWSHIWLGTVWSYVGEDTVCLLVLMKVAPGAHPLDMSKCDHRGVVVETMKNSIHVTIYNPVDPCKPAIQQLWIPLFTHFSPIVYKYINSILISLGVGLLSWEGPNQSLSSTNVPLCSSRKKFFFGHNGFSLDACHAFTQH